MMSSLSTALEASECFGLKLVAIAVVNSQIAMAQIAFRFTFLDVLLEGEERAQDLRAGRARSEPPAGPGRRRPLSPEEVEAHLYVRSLPGGITGGDAPEEQGQEQDSWEATEPQPESTTGEDPSVSAGSLGHPVLCKRPCVHAAARRFCAAGAACDFCHLCGDHRVRPDQNPNNL